MIDLLWSEHINSSILQGLIMAMNEKLLCLNDSTILFFWRMQWYIGIFINLFMSIKIFSLNFVYWFLCFLLQAPTQTQARYAEPDNRDWRGRSAQLPANADERSWDNIKENREFGTSQPNSQYPRSNQGVINIGKTSCYLFLFYMFYDLIILFLYY